MIGAACACPFYGAALFVSREPEPMAVSFPTMGNQCALITSSHSPCWMEVAENAAPDWAECPRNPEWAVAQYANLDPPQYERHRDHMSFTAHRIAARRHIDAAKREAANPS